MPFRDKNSNIFCRWAKRQTPPLTLEMGHLISTPHSHTVAVLNAATRRQAALTDLQWTTIGPPLTGM